MVTSKSKIPVTIVTGPTASGKSAYALTLAEKTPSVVINADSMQVYDPLPILTAQPDVADKEICPHVLYSVFGPEHVSTAPEWAELALKEIEHAAENNAHPLIVGGTGFYIKTLMEGLSPLPEIPAEIRDQAMVLMDELGAPQFHQVLEKIDPEMAARLNPGDTQRLIRAWEVITATDMSLAKWQEIPNKPLADHLEFKVVAILPERDRLYDTINKRVHSMIENGALKEVEALSKRLDAGEFAITNPIVKAHGFRPLKSALKNEMSMEDAIEQTQMETRQYAKRQFTWVRNQYTPDEVVQV